MADENETPQGSGGKEIIPVAIAAFLGALAGAVVASQLG